VNLEERCARATASFEERSSARRACDALFGRYYRWSTSAFALAVAIYVCDEMLRDAPTRALVVSGTLLLALLAVRRSAKKIVTEAARGQDLELAGDLESAGTIYGDILERTLVHPGARAVIAAELATTAMMAGHADRAIVLLRAIERTSTMPRAHEAALVSRTVLALLALGAGEEARRLAAARSAHDPGLRLVVEAIAGDPAEACAWAERASARSDTVTDEARLRLRHLYLAYAWNRRARSASIEEASAAIAHAATARHAVQSVPPHLYRYLLPRWPDFAAFVEGG